MSWLEYVGVCLGVGISLFVSACDLGRGLHGLSPLKACQLSGEFALVQFVLVVGGWLAGIEATKVLEGWSYWAGIVVVAVMALAMLWRRRASSVHGDTSGVDEPERLLATASWIKLHPLALGFVLTLLGRRSMVTAIMTGAMVALLTVVGIVAGSRRSLRLARGF